MLHKDASGIYKTSLFADIDGLFHGFSTRALGDGRTETGRIAISNAFPFDRNTLLQPKQIHSATIKIVSDVSALPVPDADGLVTHQRSGVTLGVRTADCVPVLLVDPVARITAAVHAGWRGTAGEIVLHAVALMLEHGAKSSHIRAVIGPHIGMCCYSVDEERAQFFRQKYPIDPKVISHFGSVWYLDIGWINYVQLQMAGVRRDHIDASITCTSCQIHDFYSYRKDTTSSFGEMLGIIGWKNV